MSPDRTASENEPADTPRRTPEAATAEGSQLQRLRPKPGQSHPGRALWPLAAAGVAAVVLVGVLVATAFVGPATLGGGNLASAALVSPSEITAWQNLSSGSAAVFSGNNTLWVHSGEPQILVRMSPTGHDLTFVINGLVNPTIRVPLGTHLSVLVVNMDLTMSHDWVVSSLAPPYGEYPMMDGGGMMGGSHEMWGSAMMGEPQGGMYWSQEMGFTLSSPGQFWYLCLYPGHAADGMYGTLIVS